MADYQKMYSLLFNEITDAIEDLDELRDRFVKLQQKCEEIYASSNDATVKMKLVKPGKNEEKISPQNSVEIQI